MASFTPHEHRTIMERMGSYDWRDVWPRCLNAERGCTARAAMPSMHCYPCTSDEDVAGLGLLPRCAHCRLADGHEGECDVHPPAGDKG